MRYYDLKRNWTKKVLPHLDNPELRAVLERDFNIYTMGRWGTTFKPGTLPEDVESCDWRWRHREPHPRFWAYVKHGACHWIVNFALRLAMLVEPTKQWRIVTSAEHSTVWDGQATLFDFNYLALGVPVAEAWKAARFGEGAEVMEVGQEAPAPAVAFLDMGNEEIIKFIDARPAEKQALLEKLKASIDFQLALEQEHQSN